MIQIEKIQVFNLEGALRGMRNPMNSWDKSDSVWVKVSDRGFEDDWEYQIGENDLDLMRRLYKAGPEHRKYMRQIFISMDITAPLYWWAEFDTYKVGVTRNSCSFMHKGVSKPFDITDFSVHEEEVYDVLSPISQKDYELVYPYESDVYKTYVGENGRNYRVYRNGRVIAEKFEYVDTKGRHRVFEEKECTPSKTKSGYFELRLGGKCGEKWLLHRLVATLFLDNPKNLYTVNHINGDKGNNCVENLEWCDLSDNIKKGFDDGLYENGKSLHAKYLKWRNGHTIVDPFTRAQILNDYRCEVVPRNELSEKYHITTSQVNNILSYKSSDNQDLFMLCYAWENTIKGLNDLRNIYLETKDLEVFQQIRCMLPSGYNQRATITMTMENFCNMYFQRKDHKLFEWKKFCSILYDELPMFQAIIEEETDNEQ